MRSLEGPLVSSASVRWRATLAQLVEQLIRNQQVIGSSPIVGSSFFNLLRALLHLQFRPLD